MREEGEPPGEGTTRKRHSVLKGCGITRDWKNEEFREVGEERNGWEKEREIK